MFSNIELVLDAKASLAEGYVGMKKQLLYWVDIMERKLCIYNPTANTNRVIALNQQIGCVVPYLEDVLLLAMENGFYSINVNTEKLTHILTPNNI